MTVAYAPGGDDRKPMIKIINRSLLKSGFIVGEKYQVTYEQGKIVINKLNQHHEISNI